MNRVGWIIFTAVVVLGLGGLVVFSRISNPSIDVSNVDTNTILAASEQSGNIADRVYGNPDAKVVLVEYGDFQCPSCGGAHPGLKAIYEEFEGDMAFVFRNFPLTTIHPNARVAAAAAEAAGLQGKYWEMHDRIFESQSEWQSLTGNERTGRFVAYANGLGLDADKFTQDLASAEVNKKISFDQALGGKIGVTSTPTFYLNGEAVDAETSGTLVQGDSSAMRAKIEALINQ